MATVPIPRRYTPAEYLDLERKATFKSEYRHGEIVAMSGATRYHNRVAGNLYRKVSDHFDDGPCEAYMSDMRVRTSPSGLYTYPDVVAVCGEPIFLDGVLDTLLNPVFIAEILSPSTEDYDRGEKFEMYQQIESVREYLLLSQNEVLAERYVKEGDVWVRSELRDIDGTLTLESLGCAIPMRDIYARVAFDNRA